MLYWEHMQLDICLNDITHFICRKHLIYHYNYFVLKYIPCMFIHHVTFCVHGINVYSQMAKTAVHQNQEPE